MSIESQLSLVRRSLPPQVELVAVSKTHPASAVEQAYRAGQRIFGESRPQGWPPNTRRCPGISPGT